MTRIGFAYNQKPEQSIVGGRIAGAARHESRSGDDPPSPISAHDDVYAEWDSAETIDAVATALSPFGDVIRIEANEDLPMRLRTERPDIVFNIAEGLYGPEPRSARPGDLRVLRHSVLRQRSVHAFALFAQGADQGRPPRARRPDRAVRAHRIRERPRGAAGE